MKLFHDQMSREEAQTTLFEYAVEHRGENMDDVKEEYREVLGRIIEKELHSNIGCMTAYHLK